jgi:hypothetical protein
LSEAAARDVAAVRVAAAAGLGAEAAATREGAGSATAPTTDCHHFALHGCIYRHIFFIVNRKNYKKPQAYGLSINIYM